MIELTKTNVLAEMPQIKGNATSVYFRQSVYNRWAVDEIFNYIDDHPEWKTIEAIEHFSALMDRYISNAISKETQWPFCVAKDQAEYLRDWCIAEEFRR